MNFSFPVTLASGQVISSNGTSTPVAGLQGYTDLLCLLNLTAKPTGGAPTLDVYLQTSFDGTNWLDVAHTQFTTNLIVRWVPVLSEVSPGTAIVNASDGALAGETIRHGPWGDQFRLKWVFALGGGAGSYTLSATGLMRG